MYIATPRLHLLPASIAALRAELEGPQELAAVLHVDVPAEWPPPLFDADWIRHVLRGISQNGEHTWYVWYFALRIESGPRLIGAGGYKGPPVDGGVEIGYSILPEYHRRGLATEAASGLIAHAFSQPDVEIVFAETLPGLHGSIGVLRNCRFEFIGQGSEPEVLRYQLTKRDWLRRAPREQNVPAVDC
jgi:RimJ/RimL family protein N-acetyltransferase